jgi:RimJ/RimL family protein N-acetyltransferase
MNMIETERLILRTWKPEDKDEYYHINQEPRVIEFLGKSMTMEEVQQFMLRANVSIPA